MIERNNSVFAQMSDKAFIAHLERHGLTPTDAERGVVRREASVLEGGIAHSILEVTGQRFGEPGGVPGESIAK